MVRRAVTATPHDTLAAIQSLQSVKTPDRCIIEANLSKTTMAQRRSPRSCSTAPNTPCPAHAAYPLSDIPYHSWTCDVFTFLFIFSLLASAFILGNTDDLGVWRFYFLCW